MGVLYDTMPSNGRQVAILNPGTKAHDPKVVNEENPYLFLNAEWLLYAHISGKLLLLAPLVEVLHHVCNIRCNAEINNADRMMLNDIHTDGAHILVSMLTDDPQLLKEKMVHFRQHAKGFR